MASLGHSGKFQRVLHLGLVTALVFEGYERCFLMAARTVS